MTEREELIAEGSRYHIGYEPARDVWNWVLKALLFLLRQGAQ